MSTRIPVTLEGNLASDPELGEKNDKPFARFLIAVNGRRRNEDTGEWEDADSVFHRVVAFGPLARNAAQSLRKGDAALVVGEMKFGTYINPETQQLRDTRDVIANGIGPSLRFATAEVSRRMESSSDQLA